MWETSDINGTGGESVKVVISASDVALRMSCDLSPSVWAVSGENGACGESRLLSWVSWVSVGRFSDFIVAECATWYWQ